MYLKTENKQALISMNLIADALFTLLEKETLEEISITQICQEAQVARKTFYRNFEFKKDIIDFRLDTIFKAYEYDLTLDLELLLVETFEYALKHQYVFTTLENNNLFHFVSSSYIKHLALTIENQLKFQGNDNSLIKQEYILHFISSTFCSTLQLWVHNNYRESTKDLASYLKIFFNGINLINTSIKE